eukprot:190945-Chlamydomonas_euryale.AAC.1
MRWLAHIQHASRVRVTGSLRPEETHCRPYYGIVCRSTDRSPVQRASGGRHKWVACAARSAARLPGNSISPSWRGNATPVNLARQARRLRSQSASGASAARLSRVAAAAARWRRCRRSGRPRDHAVVLERKLEDLVKVGHKVWIHTRPELLRQLIKVTAVRLREDDLRAYACEWA